MPLDGTGDIVDSVEGGSSTLLPSLVGPCRLRWVSGNAWGLGDTLPKAQLLLIDVGNSGAAVDLSAATLIEFRAHSRGDASQGVVVADAAADLTTTGLVVYAWAQGDLSYADTHICQVRITWLGGGTTTFQGDTSGKPSLYTVTSL